MSEQILRQGLNNITVIGVASESTLAKKEFIDKRTGQPYNAIMGDVTIKVNDEESHTLSYFAKELTRKGEKNKGYQALETAMSKMVTIADIASGVAEGEPTKYTCKGSLTLNEYKGQDGNVVSFPRINGSYAPSQFKGEEFIPSATFDIEGIVKNVTPEMQDDEETGRVKVNLYVPLYGGKVVPLSFVSDESIGANGVSYIEDNFVARSSINIWGNIVNRSKEIIRVTEAGFGGNKEEVTYDRVREFTITGGTAYEEGIHDKQIFDIKLLKEALANRERDLAALKEKETAPKAEKKSPGFGAGASASAPKTNKVQDDELDDLFGED